MALAYRSRDLLRLLELPFPTSIKSGLLRSIDVKVLALDGLCADVELVGHAVRVRYRVAAKGYGPIALALNGHTLPMTREANPYRTAGVTVPMTALLEQLGDGVNDLVVELE
jgi:hypothetical protein